MNIAIDKKELFTGLHKMSAHLGMKLSAPELVASTVDDEEKIALMLQAASMELLKLLSPYATTENSDAQIIYVLNMPANWMDDKFASLKSLCNDYLLHSLFARWLDFVKNDSAMLYRGLNNETASAIVRILSLREKPVRD